MDSKNKRVRNLMMYYLRLNEGITYRVLGEMHGVSPQRALVIVERIKLERHWWRRDTGNESLESFICAQGFASIDDFLTLYRQERAPTPEKIKEDILA